VQRRRSAEDARATEVALTPVGLELAERVHGEVCAELEPLTDGLGKADRATLTRLLMRSLTP
jgi:DNA-binding MarR family transcriptional regulator